MQLILVRHGQTNWNKEYRVQGQADLPLNASGKAQAEAIGRALKNETVDAVYSSPLSRAFETAQAIDTFHQAGITTLDGLKELDVGETDGLYYPNLKKEYASFFELWSTDAKAARFPGGESLPELQKRVWEAIQSILDKNHSHSVVVASHFFALLTLICKVLDLGLSDFRKLNISVAGISKVEFLDGKARLVCFNETCHLDSDS